MKLLQRVADHYETVATIQRETAQILAQAISCHVPRVHSILEWGAGTGFLTQSLLQQFPQSSLTVVDRSLPMLRKLHSSLREKDRVRTQLLWGNMDDCCSGKCSLICSSFALQWSRDPLQLLKKVSLQMPPGSFFAHAMPLKGSLSSLIEMGYLSPVKPLLLVMDDVMSALSSLRPIFTSEIERELYFARPIEALRYIRALGGSQGERLKKNLLSIRREQQPLVCKWQIGLWIVQV